MSELFMVFDVESVGLHGEGFAYGWVLINRNGVVMDAAGGACGPYDAKGDADGLKWVLDNVPHDLWRGSKLAARSVRRKFWDEWMANKARGATLWAECGWPVEARFLNACIDDNRTERTWEGPYPLHDVATLMLAAGMDPMATYSRLEGETPAHDPMADARQSARLLINALQRLKGTALVLAASGTEADARSAGADGPPLATSERDAQIPTRWTDTRDEA